MSEATYNDLPRHAKLITVRPSGKRAHVLKGSLTVSADGTVGVAHNGMVMTVKLSSLELV